MAGRRVFIKSPARQLKQLSEGYYINLSVKISCTASPFPMTLKLTNGQGGKVAHRLFHTRVLPHLLLKGSPFGLPDVLHGDALKATENYGGLNGPLVRNT
jgi:hypothetical protein